MISRWQAIQLGGSEQGIVKDKRQFEIIKKKYSDLVQAAVKLSEKAKKVNK